MKPSVRQRLPFILTGLLVVLAIAAIAVFLAVGTATPTASPTPTRAAGSGSEVLPPTATPTTPHLGVDPTPLVTPPLPATASATGKLVAGFPTAVISIPPGTTIESSAVTSQGDRMQASLVGTESASIADVQGYFQKSFTALGMTAGVAAAPSGTVATRYTRGNDQITVTTTAVSTGTRLTIFGVFTAAQG